MQCKRVGALRGRLDESELYVWAVQMTLSYV